MPGPIINACCVHTLRSKEEYVDTRPVSISTRRQGSEPTQQNHRNKETFCGASMEKPAGRQRDETPKPTRSRSTEVLGILAAQIPSPEVPDRTVQDTKPGGSRTKCRATCTGYQTGRPTSFASETSPRLSRRHVRKDVSAERNVRAREGMCWCHLFFTVHSVCRRAKQ